MNTATGPVESFFQIWCTKALVWELSLTHFYPPLRFRNQVLTFAVRETDVSRTANVGTVGKNGLMLGIYQRGKVPVRVIIS